MQLKDDFNEIVTVLLMHEKSGHDIWTCRDAYILMSGWNQVNKASQRKSQRISDDGDDFMCVRVSVCLL